MPLDLQVLDQMRIIWRRYGGIHIPGAVPLLDDVPQALQQDIALEDCCWILQQVRDACARAAATEGQSLIGIYIPYCDSVISGSAVPRAR